jgi:ACR3 family arsenite transporter
MSESPPNHINRPLPEKSGDLEKHGENGIPQNEVRSKESTFKNLGLLDRFLAVWIFLAMVIGILLGNFVPNTGPALQKGKFVGVSVPIGKYNLGEQRVTVQNTNFASTAVGLLVMMYPILCKVRYESLHHVFRTREIWRQIAFSIFVNWIIAPFFMVRCHLTLLDRF